MTTFLATWDPGPGTGPTVAVKDLIDVAGWPTTAASPAIADDATPAEADAACVAAIRVNGGRLVGKTNLHELAFGGTGINQHTGTPQNPLDPERMPGGSSSGSAVAVATGAADIALGTDTGGSIRTPAVACGIVGLKTTYGRIALDGVQPLAPSLDTIGPMARDVAGITTGMALLEGAFAPTAVPPRWGRFRMPGTAPAIDDAIEAVLEACHAHVAITAVDLPGWDAADRAGSTVAFVEAAEVHAALLRDHGDRLGADVRQRLQQGRATPPKTMSAARAVARRWRDELDAALESTPIIATTAMVATTPTLSSAPRFDTRRPNVAVNLAGHPAIVVPIPRPGHLPTAIQLIGRHHDEESLVAAAHLLETLARATTVTSGV